MLKENEAILKTRSDVVKMVNMTIESGLKVVLEPNVIAEKIVVNGIRREYLSYRFFSCRILF